MLDGTLFFVKSAEYRNRGKDVFPDFFCCLIPFNKRFYALSSGLINFRTISGILQAVLDLHSEIL